MTDINQSHNGVKILDRAETYIKFIAGILGFVAAMGYPALYVQYSRFNVSSSLITYNQILKAGVLPTIFLLIIGLYLLWAWKFWITGLRKKKVKQENESKKNEQVDDDGEIDSEVKGPLIPFFLFVFVFFLGLIAIWFLGFFASFKLFFLWIGRIILRALNLQVTTLNLIVTTVTIFIILQVIQWRLNKKLKSKKSLKFPRSIKPFQDRVESLIEEPLRFIVIWTLVAIIMFPLASFGLLYAIKSGLENWFPIFAEKLTRDNIVFITGCLATGIAMFGCIFIIHFLTQSDNSRNRKIGFGIFTFTLLLLFIASATIYSKYVYSEIPQGWGGDKTEIISLYINKNDFPPTIRGAWDSEKFSEEYELIRFENNYVLHLDEKTLIVADKEHPPASILCLERNKIRLIYSKHLNR